MKKKSTHILIAIFLILLGGWAMKKYLSQQGQKDVLGGKKIFEYDPASIHTVEIIKKNEIMTLKKIEGRWAVSVADDSFPADTQSVENLISELLNMKINNVVSYNLNDAARFKLDEENKVTLVLKDNNNKTHSITLGESGTSFNSIYAILPLDAKIILAGEYPGNLIKSDWRDLFIVRLSKKNIQSINFQYKKKGNSFFVTQQDKKWTLLQNTQEWEIEDFTVDSILENVFNIVAKEIPDQNMAFQESGNALQYTLSNSAFSISFGNELSDGDVYAKTSDGRLYLIDTSIKEGLYIKKESLIKK